MPPLLLLANHLRHLTKSTMLAFKGQKTMDLTHHSPSFPRWGLYLLCLARSGDWSRPHILCLAKPGLESRLPNSYPRALGPAVLCLVTQSCPILCDPLEPFRILCPWGFSRQECWSGLPCPPPGDLPNPGLPHCRRILYCLNLATIPLTGD